MINYGLTKLAEAVEGPSKKVFDAINWGDREDENLF